MTHRKTSTASAALWLALALGAASGWAAAQTAASSPAATTTPAPGFAARQVLVSPITGMDGKQIVLMSVNLAPGATSPYHMHPGDCYGSVIEGTIELRVQGMEPRRFETGQSYATLGGVPHEFANMGDKPVRMLNALVIDKGKPATAPASAPGR